MFVKAKAGFKNHLGYRLSVGGKFGGNFAIKFNKSSILLKIVKKFDQTLLMRFKEQNLKNK